MKSRSLIVFLVFVVLIPAIVFAAAKKHPQVPMEQECSECHDEAAKSWEAGKHGQVGVQCVICHGDLQKRFEAKPAGAVCAGCHAEQVSGKAEGHKIKQKNCWSCHDGHSLKTKSGK